MASPQLEHGYTRTANELSEAIMQSDFSKRQRNILDLIVRMSYGCGKKTALLRYSDFELVGVYKADIKKELDYLTGARVIVLEYTSGAPFFRTGLNKNYEQWRINIVKGYISEKWEQLLHRNLDDKVSETLTPVSEILTPQNNEVSKTLTDLEKPVSNLQTEQSQTVSKILTDTTPEVSNEADSDAPKERSIKEIDLKEKDPVVVGVENKTPLSPQAQVQKDFSAVIKAYETNTGFVISPAEGENLQIWLDQDGMPAEVIIEAIKEAVRQGKRTVAYIDGILRDWSQKGIKTLAAVATAKQEWQNLKPRDKPIARSGTVININPDVKEILDYYREAFSTSFGAAPVINEARDGEYILKILTTQSKSDLKKLIDIYLASDDEFVKKAGYTIPVMHGQLNRVILELQKLKSDFEDIDPAKYPGGPECECGGTGILAVWDPLANNGCGAHRGTTCPCKKIKPKIATKGG